MRILVNSHQGGQIPVRKIQTSHLKVHLNQMKIHPMNLNRVMMMRLRLKSRRHRLNHRSKEARRSPNVDLSSDGTKLKISSSTLRNKDLNRSDLSESETYEVVATGAASNKSRLTQSSLCPRAAFHEHPARRAP